jgi:uroporphyrinogen-III decarboxylase
MKTMTSRERVRAAINHQEPDRIPLDLGSTPVTGIHASTYARLRQVLGFPSARVKVGEPFQMLADLDEEVAARLGVDTAAVQLPSTLFGFPNTNWKPFDLFDGTPALVSEFFNFTTDRDTGDLLMHPKGDRTAPPCARMPYEGDFFDAIVRQEPDAEARLVPREFAEQQISRYTDEQLSFLQNMAADLYHHTEKSLVGCWWQGGLGDIALVPGLSVAHPKGIRDPQRWYEMLAERPDYIREIFEIQFEIAFENLKLYRQAVGDQIDVLVVSGTDFGSQRGPLLSPHMYRELFKPFHKKINDWVHQHTPWKTFYHSCGSIVAFLDDFIEAGVDIINPVQCSACGMEAQRLKEKYGQKLVFWGGGVNTQQTLPFGTPDQVRQEVAERMRVFGPGGGFVFNTIHNIQAKTPTENVVALFETVTGRKLVG